jgi:uncharacterized membrane protein
MKITRIALRSIAALAALAAPFTAFAAYNADTTGLTASGSQAGLNTAPNQLPVVIGTVIKTALGVVGIVFLVLMVYAGYIWMIARGDEAKVEKAKDTIVNCIIGIVIVVGAYAITSYLVTAFNPAPSSGSCPGTPCTPPQYCDMRGGDGSTGVCVTPQ